MTRILNLIIFVFAMILGLTSTSASAHAEPNATATAACIAKGEQDGWYWPGANPSRHYIAPNYNVAIYLTEGTNVSTDQAGDTAVRPHGKLACGVVVLINPADIDSAGMVSKGFLADCGNWAVFAPVHVPSALVTAYPGQDRKVYDPTKDDELDYLYISDAHWLSAARLSSCLGGEWDPDGRADARTGLRRPSFVPRENTGGYIIPDPEVTEPMAFQATGRNHQGDHVRNTAASMVLVRECPTDPLLVWKGEIMESDSGQYEVVCQEPQAGERIHSSYSNGFTTFESYVMDLEANGQAHPQPNGTIDLTIICETELTLAELDQTANEEYANTYRGLSGGVDALFGGGSRIGTCDVCSTDAPLSTALLRPYLYAGGPAFGLEVAGRFGALGNHADMDFSANAVYGGDISLLMNAEGPLAVRAGMLLESGFDPYYKLHALRVGPELALEVRALSWYNRKHLPHFIVGGNAGWYQYADDTEMASELGRNQDMSWMVFGGIGGQLPALKKRD